MNDSDIPAQMPTRKVTESWSVLPSWLPVPGLGALPVNSCLKKCVEPMLVDTILAALSDDFVGYCRKLSTFGSRMIFQRCKGVGERRLS